MLVPALDQRRYPVTIVGRCVFLRFLGRELQLADVARQSLDFGLERLDPRKSIDSGMEHLVRTIGRRLSRAVVCHGMLQLVKVTKLANFEIGPGRRRLIFAYALLEERHLGAQRAVIVVELRHRLLQSREVGHGRGGGDSRSGLVLADAIQVS